MKQKQKDKRIKGQKDKKTKGQTGKKDKRTKGPKDKRTNGQKDKRKKGQKENIFLKKIFEVLCCILGTCTFLFLSISKGNRIITDLR